jgi:hypothetical protein
MTKEQKAINKANNTQIRKKKKKAINAKRKQDAENELLNCPFDVDMNGKYGTCTCGGANRESCAMST